MLIARETTSRARASEPAALSYDAKVTLLGFGASLSGDARANASPVGARAL
jgi:hypothetical protein